MTDIDRLLASTLRQRAELAPEGERLLSAVHTRSRQVLRRRRVATVAGATLATLAIALPVAIAGIVGGRSTPQPSASRSGASTTASASPSGSGLASTPGSPNPSQRDSRSSIRFEPSTFTAATMPLRLPDARAAEFDAPVVTIQDGALVAYYAAKDPVDGADVTLAVTSGRPAFGQASAAVSELAHQVRSRSGTLRTVAVTPAARLVLYWQESQTRWVQVRTDDTFTADQVVALANSLIAATLPVVVPLRFDLAPVGAALESMTPFGVTFRAVQAAGGTAATTVSCTVVEPRTLTGTTIEVGQYHATLRRGADSAVLTVAMPDWRVTLLVEVPAKYSVSDADLIRFAGGVHLMDRAETRESSADGIGGPID